MYTPDEARYSRMPYVRCGRSGLKLPAISLGLWHNFGGPGATGNMRAMLFRAFDLGITHFDLANNYGPPYGSAEDNFGRILRSDLRPWRDEMILSTKAGYDMWPGPYGDWGSRKYLLASLDQSLRRMGLEYVDIFYSHRPDPETPVEETMSALDSAVRAGKALYAGISNYDPAQTAAAAAALRRMGTPCLIHQMKYSMFARTPERGLFQTLEAEGAGGIAFSPLALGMLTDRYLNGIPADSRAGRDGRFLNASHLTEDRLARIRALNGIARERGQSLARMALAWVLRQPAVTSALIGASATAQIEDCAAAAHSAGFTEEELRRIDQILGSD
ncbi:MAG TPA: aldo/keto reductase [Bryobacteraceae bacterium]|nr:aldo/keto reductase [Bryobacteraceae bacterium]